MKAYAYLRVSGKGQVEGDGFERQLLAIKKYGLAHNIRIVKVFREQGVSGTTDWDDRKAFTEMMAELLANGTRTVLVENLSRLARDLMVQESIIRDFREKRLELVSVAEPDLDSDDPARVLMRQMMGAFHQYEKAMLVAKLRGARQRKKARTGACEGRKGYGFHAEEQTIVERIKALRGEGLPLQKIADRLNRKGMKTRMGKQWTAVQVNRVTKREAA
jgi:DNA invertase Pin-like site-specific DNA recombinase